MKDFSFTDILAFGNILEVQEKEDFQEFVEEIMVAFNQKPRNIRRQLLKLAKDVSKDNRSCKKLEKAPKS